MEKILNEIKNERLSQKSRLGPTLGQDAIMVHSSSVNYDLSSLKDLETYRKEIIQSTAVSVAIIECLDKKIQALQGGGSRQLEIQFPD